nr:hypothetical protein Iba_chr08dCG6290 [Ipomoea batatas]
MMYHEGQTERNKPYHRKNEASRTCKPNRLPIVFICNIPSTSVFAKPSKNVWPLRPIPRQYKRGSKSLIGRSRCLRQVCIQYPICPRPKVLFTKNGGERVSGAHRISCV